MYSSSLNNSIIDISNACSLKFEMCIRDRDNLSKNFIDNIKIVVPPSEFIEKLNLAAIVEQMTLNTKEITWRRET